MFIRVMLNCDHTLRAETATITSWQGFQFKLKTKKINGTSCSSVLFIVMEVLLLFLNKLFHVMMINGEQ